MLAAQVPVGVAGAFIERPDGAQETDRATTSACWPASVRTIRSSKAGWRAPQPEGGPPGRSCRAAAW